MSNCQSVSRVFEEKVARNDSFRKFKKKNKIEGSGACNHWVIQEKIQNPNRGIEDIQFPGLLKN